MRVLFGVLVSVVVLFNSTITMAEIFPLPSDGVDIVGENGYTLANQKDTLLDIARRNGIGQKEILLANPGVDRWIPGANTQVLLPKRYILPDTPREGIVLNIPEMRMYFYPPREDERDRQVVITHPISIGRMDWTTPLGVTKVIQKTIDPSWRPPKSIKKEHAEEGEILPDVVPPGPDNPLGRYAMRLGVPGYLIHSTNKPFGVGMRVTHGCVRMYPEDIEKLFPTVKLGTAVHIVNQPVKVSRQGEKIYIEVHPPLEEEDLSYMKALNLALDLIDKKSGQRSPLINGYALRTALKEHSGIAILISKMSRPKELDFIGPPPHSIGRKERQNDKPLQFSSLMKPPRLFGHRLLD